MNVLDEHIREQDSRECRACGYGSIWPCDKALFRPPGKDIPLSQWSMCPHCASLFYCPGELIPVHQYNGSVCGGTGQNPRNPESDGRPLWNGLSNPHFYRNQPEWTSESETKQRDVIDYFGTGSDAGDHSFLSNFYRSGRTTVEHHYQAAKTDDPAWAARILAAPTPGQAKKLGRKAPMRATWDDEKDAVMLVLLRLKFSNPDLAARLLATGDAELIEGNTWGDQYWGVSRGLGENHLGKLLMQVRNELQVKT